jgi:hypothetical protein
MRHIVHEMDLRVLDAMCRIDFASFVHRSFHTLSPGSKLKMNWHIYAIAYEIADDLGRLAGIHIGP